MRRLVLCILVVGSGEVLLLAAGGGDLAGPEVRAPGTWVEWSAARSTDAAVLALVRLGALWAGAYLLTVLVVGALTRTLRVRPLLRLVDAVTPTALRRLLDRATGMAAAGAVVVASVATGAGPAAAHEHAPLPTSTHGPPITLRGLSGPRPEPRPTTTTTVTLPAAATPQAAPAPAAALEPPTGGGEPAASGTPAATRSAAAAGEPSPAAGSGSTSVEPSHPPAVEQQPPTATGHTGGGGEWTVQRGDNFWTIAEARLAEAWGRRPSPAQTHAYWRALIEANRSRLADRHNPDLLFPGQVLAVPPPPPQAA